MATSSDISARGRLLMATGHTVSGLFLALGILAALRTHLDQTAQLAMFTVSPAIAAVWLVLGIVGVSAVVSPRPARIYLLVAGALLLLWGALGLLIGGDGGAGEMFVRDVPLVTLHLVAGAVALAVCGIPTASARRPSPSDSSPGRTA